MELVDLLLNVHNGARAVCALFATGWHLVAMVLIKHVPLPPAQPPACTGFSTSFALQVMKAQQTQQARDRSNDWGEA